MTLAETVAFARAADDRWQSYLDAVGIDRWSDGSSYRGSRAGELYEAKVAADAIMLRAFEQDRQTCSR